MLSLSPKLNSTVPVGKCLYCLKFLIVFISFPGDCFIMLFKFLHIHLMHKADLRSVYTICAHTLSVVLYLPHQTVAIDHWVLAVHWLVPCSIYVEHICNKSCILNMYYYYIEERQRTWGLEPPLFDKGELSPSKLEFVMKNVWNTNRLCRMYSVYNNHWLHFTNAEQPHPPILTWCLCLCRGRELMCSQLAIQLSSNAVFMILI